FVGCWIETKRALCRLSQSRLPDGLPLPKRLTPNGRRRLSVEPISVALEGVGGERDRAAGIRLVKGAPVDLGAAHITMSEGFEQLLPFAALVAKRGSPEK